MVHKSISATLRLWWPSGQIRDLFYNSFYSKNYSFLFHCSYYLHRNFDKKIWFVVFSHEVKIQLFESKSQFWTFLNEMEKKPKWWMWLICEHSKTNFCNWDHYFNQYFMSIYNNKTYIPEINKTRTHYYLDLYF